MVNPEFIIPQPKSPPEDLFNLRINENEVYIVSEEEGTIWVWAFPDLLKWPFDIAWLYPKVSNDGPGDLWGIDSTGDLIIVETKRSTRKNRLQDPFEDFLKNKFWQQIELLNPDFLFEKWKELYNKEIEWIEVGCRTPDGAVPGVVPYSYHRSSILRWFDFYALHIIPQLKNEQYSGSVKKFLKRRRDRDRPSQHFVGLYTVTHLKKPGLSSKGVAHYKELAKQIGIDHIHQRAVRCLNLGNGTVKIETVNVEPSSRIDVV